MEKLNGRLVYTGDILKRGGDRFDVVVADENVFVVCKRTKRYGEETGVTSYRSPEIYSNDSEYGSLERAGFTLDGTWLLPGSLLEKAVTKQKAADGRSVKKAAPDRAWQTEVPLPDETSDEEVDSEESGEE